MKKLVILSVILLLSINGLKTFAIPTYSDDIPQDYIKEVKGLIKYDKTREYTDNIPETNSVKIYSPKKISNKLGSKKINGIYMIVYKLNVNDKIKFIVAEDVQKNGQLYIKKGTEVTGIVRTIEPGLLAYYPPGIIEISYFSTKDVNGNIVNLYGKIKEEGKETGLFQFVMPYIPSLSPSIRKNKIYTIYYK